MGWDSIFRNSNHILFLVYLMIIDDLYLIWTQFCPYKANPITLVYTDAVLSFPITSQGFQSFPWRYAKIIESFNGIELIELSERDNPNILRT